MKEEIYALTFELEQTYWWYVARREIILDQLGQHPSASSQASPRQFRILDFGCGTGINLIAMEKFGDVYGVDISTKAIDFCKQRGLTNVLQINRNDLRDENPFGEKFDLLTTFDVLEHIEDEQAKLQTLAHWIKPGGFLAVTVPAYKFLWSGEDFVSQHLRRYTASQLKILLQRSGYQIHKLTYFNTLLFPSQAIAIFWKRLFQPELLTQSNLDKLPDGLNKLLTHGLCHPRDFC